MIPKALKPAPTMQPHNAFRGCDKKDNYLAVSACKEKGQTKRSCRKCYECWKRERLQPSLPFKLVP